MRTQIKFAFHGGEVVLLFDDIAEKVWIHEIVRGKQLQEIKLDQYSKPIDQKFNLGLHLRKTFCDPIIISERDGCCESPKLIEWFGFKWIGVPKLKRKRKEKYAGCGCLYRLKMIVYAFKFACCNLWRGFTW